MSVTTGVLAGLATLPSASAAHGDFSKGFGAAVGHGFRSPSHGGGAIHGQHRGHRHIRSHYRPSYVRPYIGAYIPYSHYRHPNRSGFYWPRQNDYPASVPSQGRIYVVPTPRASAGSSGFPVRRIIVINPSPFQEAGSAILNRPENRDAENDEMELEEEPLSLDFPAASARLPTMDESQGWEHLRHGQAQEALTVFSWWAMAEPDNLDHKLGYGLAAAMSGDKITAAYALRVVYERKAPVDLPSIDTPLQRVLEDLAGRYRETVEPGPPSRDDLFVAGALSHLLRQPAAGLRFVKRALDSGEHSPSLEHLQHALESDRPDGWPSPAVSQKEP